MKKWISLLLTCCLLLSLCVPAFAETVQGERPMIYLEGQGIYLYTDDGTLVYDVGVSLTDSLSANSKDLIRYLLRGKTTGNFSAFNDLLYDTIAPAYEAEKLGKDGMPRDGSHVHPDNMWRGQRDLSNIEKTIPMTGGRKYPVYRWHFDWRLSPITLAEELHDLIDAVLEKTGASQVDLVSRCLSTNIVYAYLYQYGTEKVHSSVFYAASLHGIGVANALFTGNLVIDDDAVERFAAFYRDQNNLVVRDEPTTDLIFALLSLLNEMKLLGLEIDNIQNTFDKVKGDVLVRILRDSFGTYPSYWSMVSADQYEAARQFVFGGVEAEWAGLLEKTDAYYEMQKHMDEFLLSISDKVHIGVIAKYGFPNFPLSEDACEESDGYVATRFASLGATCADVNKTLEDSYIRAAVQKGSAKYVSADCKIDASTALFPDTTWFIKDLYHTHFPDCINDLCAAFANDDAMTVWTDPAYTQFLQYEATNSAGSDHATGVLSPIRSLEDTHDNTAQYQRTFWSVLRDFFKKLGAFLKSLFQK